MTLVELASEAAIRGARLLEHGLPSEARATLRAAVAAGDRRLATQLNLALAEEKSGDVEAARRRMGELEEACPDWDEPPLRVAESLRRFGDWPAAEQAYRRVLDLNPARREALVALGAGLVAHGRPEEALPFLLRACDQPDPGFEAWHAIGVARLALGDAAQAEAALANAGRAAPDRLRHRPAARRCGARGWHSRERARSSRSGFRDFSPRSVATSRTGALARSDGPIG